MLNLQEYIISLLCTYFKQACKEDILTNLNFCQSKRLVQIIRLFIWIGGLDSGILRMVYLHGYLVDAYGSGFLFLGSLSWNGTTSTPSLLSAPCSTSSSSSPLLRTSPSTT